ncbi:MAG: D-ribose pyranase [Ignavibacteriaceae bacterium]
MKKNGILNAPLSKAVALMGHTDRLVICDCGLPIPKNAEIIDLALTKNIPRFIDVLKIVLEELHVEDAIVAEEIINENNGLFNQISSLLKNLKIKKVPHENFKKLTRKNGTITFVRTGEATPFANIILVSGVTFN